MDIDKLLANANIKALNEFHQEPVIVPPAQHVRQFLAVVASPVWLDAVVVSYCVPSGYLHQAMMMDTSINLLVFEAVDGSLSLLQADNVDDGPALSRMISERISQTDYRRERKFMNRVSRCVPEIAQIIRQADGVHHKHKVALIKLLLDVEQQLEANWKDKYNK